jgi:hypothetical protein
MDCYVNGVPVSASGIFPTAPSSSTFTDFKIGGNYLPSAWTGSLSGSIGQLMVYNRQLTDDEIYSDYLIQARRYSLPERVKPYTIDSSAYVYTQAVGITDTTTINAINTFVGGLKSASLWDKMIAIYPFLGADTTKTRYNLKDVSLSTTQLDYSGSWTASTSGSKSNNTSSYGILSNIKPTYNHPLISSQSFHMAYLSYDTPVSDGFAMGTSTGSIGTETGSAIFISTTGISSSINSTLTGSLTTGGPIGMITVSRTGSNSYTIAKNKVPVTVTARASASLNSNLFLNSININNSSYSSSQNNIAYVSVGAGLTDSEVGTYYDLVDTFQTSLGRFDLDAWNFIGNAQILDVTQQQAINTLVLDLKSFSLWDKMKAIYPFVGQASVSSSFSYNLKNPNTFRGTFSGSWTYSSTGVTGDGISAYMDTNFNPNTSSNANSKHMSYYSRNNFNNCQIGIIAAGIYDQIFYSGAWYNILSTDSYSAINIATTKGLVIASRTTSTSGCTTFVNNSNVGNDGLTASGNPNGNLWLNSRNPGAGYSGNQCAFASIGDGLTDTDASNLYTAVQRFQTTLGRQV